MKKWLTYLTVVVLLFGVCVSPLHGTQVIRDNISTGGVATIVMINSFDAQALNDLMIATANLQRGNTLTIRTHGPGGDAFVCMSMILYLDSLKARGVNVRTETWGYAASANFFVWIVGDERAVHASDLIMSHLIIPRNSLGQKLNMSQLSADQKWVINQLNTWITVRLKQIVPRTSDLYNMLNDDSNWYTGQQIYEMKIATELI